MITKLFITNLVLFATVGFFGRIINKSSPELFHSDKVTIVLGLYILLTIISVPVYFIWLLWS